MNNLFRKLEDKLKLPKLANQLIIEKLEVVPSDMELVLKILKENKLAKQRHRSWLIISITITIGWTI
jgi:hypothetical protein